MRSRYKKYTILDNLNDLKEDRSFDSPHASRRRTTHTRFRQ